MAPAIYRYDFDRSLNASEIEQTLLLAIIACESLHGESRVRMDARYFMDRARGACVVDARTEVGRDVARIFTGYVIREFGKDAFTVKRVEHVPDPEPVGAAA